jgi:glycosyltransferase involved in cell wall biosynthesis
MISILIPVYNTEVVTLINELSQQLNRINIEGEIIVFDDGSSPDFRELNKSIYNLKNVSYRELNINYGRTGIRQLLAAASKYAWLLFLDSDSRIVHSDFLQRYIAVFRNEFDVVTGGRVYPAKPGKCNKRLHWKYGVKRESVRGNKTAFHTNNFCIKKEAFQQLNFPDFLKTYGHEDTWMGIELERTERKICRIDNAVEHLKIEETKIFLEKTETALQNLLWLDGFVDRKVLCKHVSLFRVYSYAKKWKVGFAVTLFFRSFRKKIFLNLNSCNPSLLFFDLYRLYTLIQLSKKSE